MHDERPIMSDHPTSHTRDSSSMCTYGDSSKKTCFVCFRIVVQAAAAAIETAVDAVLDSGIVTKDVARPGQASVSTSAFGDAVVKALKN